MSVVYIINIQTSWYTHFSMIVTHFAIIFVTYIFVCVIISWMYETCQHNIKFHLGTSGIIKNAFIVLTFLNLILHNNAQKTIWKDFIIRDSFIIGHVIFPLEYTMLLFEKLVSYQILEGEKGIFIYQRQYDSKLMGINLAIWTKR